jgi:hypothetical protein
LRLIVEKQDGAFAVIRVAIVIAVDEVRPGLSQIAWADWRFAHHAEGLPEGRPAIYEDVSHAVVPGAKQNNALNW